MSEIDPRIGALMNKKEEIDYIIVVEKATGGLVALESMRQFDNRVHKMREVKAELTQVPEVKIEEPIIQEEIVLQKSTEEDLKKIRYEELKGLKAWLKPTLKEEYNALKAIYG